MPYECLFKYFNKSLWIAWFFCVQISPQKHRPDPREERRSEKTQGATCSPSTETWVVSYILKLKYDFHHFLGTNLVLIVSCFYSQLQKLRLRTCQVSSGWHVAVCAGVRYHQAFKCFPSWRSETSFSDSCKPPPQWTRLQRQRVEYTETRELYQAVAE